MIKTSSWYTRLPLNHVRIGISRGVPRGFREVIKRYTPLNPGTWFKSCPTPHDYYTLYWALLAELDAEKVVREIGNLAGVGKTAVLVCFEAPPPNEDWCHRGLVSAWLWETLELTVPELNHEALGHGWQHPKLHYTLQSKDASGRGAAT